MTELRFHHDLYAEKAVRQAVATFTPYAAVACADGPDHWRVSIAADEPGRERKVARELANFALGLTVQSRGAAA